MSECRSCKAEIVWMETERGKRIPVDAETVNDTGAKIFDPAQGMVSHFSTCPDAKDWSKGKPKPPAAQSTNGGPQASNERDYREQQEKRRG